MCLNPVRLPDGHGFFRYVPCGKCLQCLKSYQDSWCARLNEEIKMWNPVEGYKPVIFFTLDFRNDTIPCRYLVVGKYGLFFQDTKPSCKVYDFWTDTRRESRAKWLARRKDMLSTYWEYVQLMYALRHLELPASFKDIIDGNYIYNMSGFEKIKPMYFLKDLPEFNPIEFFSFSNGGLEHPKGDSDLVFFDYSDVHAPEDYLVAFEFHTCRKDIFQGWLKRSRAALSYNVPDVFGSLCNPRINRYWYDSDKNRLSLPDSALTSTFKYFLTTEYGPKTNRPHAHGVVFGVTSEEFEDYFVKDWQDRYGRVVYSVLNPTGGAMLYVAKYCSKGEYEHPYCKRDYFYSSGEYHSKKYEDVLLDFGFDLPIVVPTFHLVSKGIGACYCYSKEIQNYFGVMLSQLISPTGKLRYTSSSVHYGLPLTPLRDLLNLDNTGHSLSCYLDLSFVGDDLRIRKYSDSEHKYLLGEDIIPRDVLIDSAVESFFYNLKYYRTYVKQKEKKGSTSEPSLWHRNPGAFKCDCEVKQTCINLPSYYKKVLLSPLASLLHSSALHRFGTDLCSQERRLVLQYGYTDEVRKEIEQLRNYETNCQKDTYKRLRGSALNFYSAKVDNPNLY